MYMETKTVNKKSKQMWKENKITKMYKYKLVKS